MSGLLWELRELAAQAQRYALLVLNLLSYVQEVIIRARC
jgi:hypothetical protein